MKPTDRVKEQLINSVKVLTESECIILRSNKPHIRHTIGGLSPDVKALEQSENELFTNEIEHQWQQYSVFVSSILEQKVTLVIKDKQAQINVANEIHGERRQAVTTSYQASSLNLELFSTKGLPKWLLALAEPDSKATNVSSQQLLLSLCTSILDSLKVFNQLHALTEDSLTKLQSRTALQNTIDEQAASSGMNLCMIHCRDFQIVNRKFGQAKGDQVLNEIATIIYQNTRTDDLACRFGGALFGIASKANSIDEGLALAQKLQAELHNRPYLRNAIRLSFNFGIAHIRSEELTDDGSSPSSIAISRAERALKAAQVSDKPSIVQWEADKFNHEEQDFNYMGGIFTPDNVTNYRNMLLLWDISSIIADEHEFSRLLNNVIERLAYTFEFQYAGIYSPEKGDSFSQAVSVSDMADTETIPITKLPDAENLASLCSDALQKRDHIQEQKSEKRYLVIPIGAELKACFFLIGKGDTLDLTNDSVMLFAGFARQLGKALKRSQLEDELNRRLEQQNAQLASELDTLKTGLKSSALVYRSQKMQQLVSQTQRAAQTDTTVLISGESGTGKEKLIHAIHNLSPRNKQSLVIVDCGSIPETLIESELFGYVKGAFTGAQNSNTGKIQAADGGILVLDEIGELPLAMQPKLLRFVQEKHFTPVGGNKSIKVDVKIIAVTNRNLANEVDKGNFRQDLYYRLNVVTLNNPPLRDRLEDLDLLSQHFLAKFASQFETSNKYLSQATLEKMKQYQWPGNIRELENKLMQASLMCQNDEVRFDDLNLSIDSPASPPVSTYTTLPANTSTTLVKTTPAAVDSEALDTHSSHMPVEGSINDEALKESDTVDDAVVKWRHRWSQALESFLIDVMSQPELSHAQIGCYLEQQVFKLSSLSHKTNKDIAHLLQIPVSTARRKLLKFQSQTLPALPRSFEPLQTLIQDLVDEEVKLHAPLDMIKISLLETILKLGPINMSQAAQLVGVSEPTLYKLKRLL
ncbi:sigma 54-interacting transcriptional regulator [Ningiella sp. W23]|uniref:sigma 54-interacting transcriptional regulator n=1 Tax=Ningiella sp. W23 TaxID=3023715 RepID=UPI0037563450